MISAKEAYRKSADRLHDRQELEWVCNHIDNDISYGRFMCECDIGKEFFTPIKREPQRNGYKVRIVRRHKRDYSVNISWANVKI